MLTKNIKFDLSLHKKKIIDLSEEENNKVEKIEYLDEKVLKI